MNQFNQSTELNQAARVQKELESLAYSAVSLRDDHSIWRPMILEKNKASQCCEKQRAFDRNIPGNKRHLAEGYKGESHLGLYSEEPSVLQVKLDAQKGTPETLKW